MGGTEFRGLRYGVLPLRTWSFAGPDGKLGAGGEAKLAQRRGNVAFDRALTQDEGIGNGAVRKPARHKAGDFLLPAGQARARARRLARSSRRKKSLDSFEIPCALCVVADRSG